MVQRSDQYEFFAPERLLAFSDGVFAVVITLLVLDLRLPETGHGDAAMLEALRSMAPKLFIFAFTFIIVGMDGSDTIASSATSARSTAGCYG